MPSASHDQIELQEIAPGYSSRFTDWGGITVAFEKAHAGQDASAMVRGLPDDRCQAPHWGFLFSGRIAVHFDDRTETIEGGQAYYIAPGHSAQQRRSREFRGISRERNEAGASGVSCGSATREAAMFQRLLRIIRTKRCDFAGCSCRMRRKKSRRTVF